MSNSDTITRDEFILEQIKGSRTMYAVLAVVYFLTAAAAFIMAVAAVATGKLHGLIPLLGMGATFVLAGITNWEHHKEYVAALEEIGSNPTGLSEHLDYSEATERMIVETKTDSKTFMQLWIAYGIMGVTMVGLGLLLIVLLLDSDPEVMLIALGGLLAAGGVVLFAMAVTAFRNWRIALQFESGK